MHIVENSFASFLSKTHDIIMCIPYFIIIQLSVTGHLSCFCLAFLSFSLSFLSSLLSFSRSSFLVCVVVFETWLLLLFLYVLEYKKVYPVIRCYSGSWSDGHYSLLHERFSLDTGGGWGRCEAEG